MKQHFFIMLFSAVLTSVGFAQEGIVLSSPGSNQSQPATNNSTQPLESVDAICNASNETFKDIQLIIDKLKDGRLNNKDLDNALVQIKTPWENRNLNNRCNDFRFNEISCPPSSQEMKLIKVSDSIIAIINILSYKADHAFSPQEIQDRFDAAKAIHVTLCKSLK